MAAVNRFPPPAHRNYGDSGSHDVVDSDDYSAHSFEDYEEFEEATYDDDDYIEEIVVDNDDVNNRDDNVNKEGNNENVAVVGMAAIVAAAANQRKERIDSGGRRRVRQEDVKPPPVRTDAQGFAAMAAAVANRRSSRIDAGGNLKVRNAPPQREEVLLEHKQSFVSIAEEAANLGRLVRLHEKVVEAESDRRSQQTDMWNGPGGLQNDQRSNAMRAINEAAALGRMRRLKPKEVTNYDASVPEKEEERVDIDKLVDNEGRRVLRTHYLLDQHVEDERRQKSERWDPESLDRRTYHSIEEVELPTKQLPSFRRRPIKYESQKEALENISNHVAAAAWDRKFRLQRPKAELRVTKGCQCPYCKNPNPFQTHKYKTLEMKEEVKSGRNSDARRRKRAIEAEQRNLYSQPLEDKTDPPNRRPEKNVNNTYLESAKATPKEKVFPQEQNPSKVEQVQIVNDGKNEALSNPTFLPNRGQHSSYRTGTRVLLDETIDFGSTHRMVYVKKEKLKKEKKEKACKERYKKGKDKNVKGKKKKKRVSSRQQSTKNRSCLGCMIM